MDIRRALYAILKRWWLIFLLTAIGFGATYALSASRQPMYQSSVHIMIDQGNDPRTDPLASLVIGERSAKTFIEVMRSSMLLSQVVTALNLPMAPGHLASRVSATPIRDTKTLKVAVEDESPTRAKAIVDKVVEVFIKYQNEGQQAIYRRGMEDLDRQIEALEKEIDDKQKSIAALGGAREARSASMPEFARFELARLESSLSRDQAVYAILLRSREDFRLAAARAVWNISVLTPAEVVTTPLYPRPLSDALRGALAALGVALVLAYLLEMLDDRVRSSEDLNRFVEMPVLGVVPRLLRSRNGHAPTVPLPVREPKSSAAEAYRMLRTNLDFVEPDRSLRTLLITSSRASEGKTTVASNLASVMAQAGRRVVLVDTDLRRPNLHKMFGLSNSQGLTNALLQDPPCAAGYLQDCGVENLRILATGVLPPNPSELLGSRRMARLIESLKNEADLLIFDSPPVLPVADPVVLSTQVDGVVIVIDSGSTRGEAVKRAHEALARVGANILGTVLNKLSSGHGGYYYYYGYYGSYYGADEKNGATPAKR